MGRPTIQTPEIIEEICSRLSEGEPLAQICRSDGLPGLRTVYDWAEAQPEVSARIARAREAGEDVIAADCLHIADTPMEGVRVETTTGEHGGSKEVREDMLGHRKLQIDTRLKLLAKWNPKKWGDRITQELTGKGGGPIAITNADELTDEQLVVIAARGRPTPPEPEASAD